MPAEAGHHIVGHSETGHHHVFDATNTMHFRAPDNDGVSFLKFESDSVDLVHLRGHDTHQPIRFLAPGGGALRIYRQREHTPEGWQRVTD